MHVRDERAKCTLATNGQNAHARACFAKTRSCLVEQPMNDIDSLLANGQNARSRRAGKMHARACFVPKTRSFLATSRAQVSSMFVSRSCKRAGKMHARDERAKCTLARNGQSARSRRTGKMHARDERAKCTLATNGQKCTLATNGQNARLRSLCTKNKKLANE